MRSAVVHPHTWTFVFFGIALIAAIIFLTQFLSWSVVVFIAVCAAGCAVAISHPTWGVIALAALAPMSGLAINFSRDPSLSRIPYLGAVNAPIVDLFAIALLAVIVVLFFVRPETLSFTPLKPWWKYLSVFYCAVALSVYFGESLFFGTEVKAFFRPYLFAFVAFALPVMMLLRNRSDFLRTLFAYECAAVVGALIGVASFFVGHVVGFARAMPITIFGYSPFGVNHNVLAESLTAIIPFAWWFAFGVKHTDMQRRALFLAAGLLTVISLLTFSRAAWIVVALQALFFAWWKFRASRRAMAALFVGVVCALGIFFATIQSTVVADSSDKTRADLLGIALTYWQRAPWFGQGPGTYLTFVGETAAFKMEYGDPMDAHGVVQKMLLEIGIVGLVTFVALVVALCRALWQQRASSFHAMLFVTVISLWGFQLFNTGYFDGKVWVLMGVALAAAYQKK